jgi:hypothetical protein
MTELDMTAEAETENFTDDLSDEALDREEGRLCACTIGGCLSMSGNAVTNH